MPDQPRADDAIGSALLTMRSDRKHWTRACADPGLLRGLQRLDVVWDRRVSRRS
jgi:hypothetical protein